MPKLKIRFFFLLLTLLVVPLFQASPAWAIDRYVVKPYVLIPADWKDRIDDAEKERYKRLLLFALQESQQFYREKLDGHTFQYDPNVQFVYSNKEVGAESTNYSNDYTHSVYLDLGGEELIPDQERVVSLTVVVGSGYRRSDGTATMDGQSGRITIAHQTLLYLDDQNKDHIVSPGTSPNRGDYKYFDKNFALASFPHELGHAFGLSSNTSSSNGALFIEHPCTVISQFDCKDEAPLPFPGVEEANGSIMHYLGLDIVGSYGLHGTGSPGFNNSIVNPEKKILYLSPFVNPNQDPAPQPTPSYQVHLSSEAPTDVIVSNYADFRQDNQDDDQGSTTKIYKTNQPQSVDWRMFLTDQDSGKTSRIYVREMKDNQVVKEYHLDVEEGTLVHIQTLDLTPRRSLKINFIRIRGTTYSPHTLGSLQSYPKGLPIFLKDDKQVPIEIDYANGTQKYLVINFQSRTAPAAANVRDSRCREDVNYCEAEGPKKGHKIHKHGGEWNGHECKYLFDDVGQCDAATPKKEDALPKGGITTAPITPAPQGGVSTVPVIANPSPVTVQAPAPGHQWTGYGISSNCGGQPCKPVNLRAECKDGKASFYWTRMDGNPLYQIRVDDTSTSWFDGATDYINDTLGNGAGYQTPETPIYQIYPVKDGTHFKWWLHMKTAQGTSEAVNGPEISCGPVAATQAPVAAQGNLTNYCPGGVCPETNGFKNSCSDGKIHLSWPAQSGAKFYLVRIDQDPDSWNGQYAPNANAGDIVWDSTNGFQTVNGQVLFNGTTGWTVDKNHNYKVWVHAAYDDVGSNYNGQYKGSFGSRLDGGTVTCL